MVLKSEIEIAFFRQQANVQQLKVSVEREYLQKMDITSSHIEVVSGVRRCGKSTLLKRIMKTHKGKLAYFNFEDSRVFDFEVSDFRKLDEVMGKKVSAYFFDEIQNVPSWEIFVRELHDRGDKVFITGSNASLLSQELGTRLTGRHLRHELFPFSYPEFLKYTKQRESLKAFGNYLTSGGFPEYLASGNHEMLQNLLKDIVLRDIAIRHGVKNTKTLMELTLFLFSNIGKEVTFNRLKNAFSIGSANSVSDYLSWLEDGYLLFYLPKFSYSAKTSSVNPRKVYAIDNGMVYANSLSFSEDTGRLLENMVFLHLRRTSSHKLFYFKEKGECDFVVFEKNKCKYLIQVCQELHGENQKRELTGLAEAMQFFKVKQGLILTLNQRDELNYEGSSIKVLPIRDFIVGKE